MAWQLPYTDPASIFRIYRKEECDSEGYPLIWDIISAWVKQYTGWRCADCGRAYRQSSYLTVHHLNERKDDCRWENLLPLCWVCHQQDHSHRGHLLKCPVCKEYSLGWAAYRQHIRGMHPHFHIRWSSGCVSWEVYPTQRRAKKAARDFPKPGETFTIEEHDEGCEICSRHLRGAIG
jgi:hypothetical protein